ncbi:DUF1127 domain-containing protein [Taklimakanibacter deserti]|uniref:DUF1127 domain-containing protein n=1 Tax=Taklimakanibacter deserti TaxID=2267839 RepID=UPI0013C4E9A9
MSKASPGSLTAHLSDFVLNAKALWAFARHRKARCDTSRLGRFNDFMLKDIGLTRADILSAAHGKVYRRD